MTQGSEKPPHETGPDSAQVRHSPAQSILVACLLGAIIALIVIAALTFR